MRFSRNFAFPRDLRAGRHFDLFLVTAVSTLLLIRFLLYLTGYPTVGGSNLHVAHMLWGGLLMLASIVVLLTYHGNGSRRFAALVGGAGFGTFIDEVGKFVTHDNDYFFRPSVAIIYVIFVLLYLAIRSLMRRGASREENLVNAIQEFSRAGSGELDVDERDRALAYLARAGSENTLAQALTQLLKRSELQAAVEPGFFEIKRRSLVAGYRRLATTRGFSLGLPIFFTGQLVVKLIHLGIVLLGRKDPGALLYRLQNPLSAATAEAGTLDAFLLGASILQSVFVGLGLAALRRSRLDAFRMFQRSILVSILFSQAFLFFRDQWTALLGLAFNLLVFTALRFVIEHESK